jgi:hypothetical protein
MSLCLTTCLKVRNSRLLYSFEKVLIGIGDSEEAAAEEAAAEEAVAEEAAAASTLLGLKEAAAVPRSGDSPKPSSSSSLILSSNTVY